MLNIITLFVLGRKYPVENDVFKMFIESMRLMILSHSYFGRGTELDIFPWLRYLGNQTYKNLCQYNAVRDEVYEKIKRQVCDDLVDSKENGPHGAMHDLMRLLSQDNTENKKVEEMRIKCTVFNLFNAGTFTSSSSYYSFLNLMIWYPQVQRKLQEEVDRLVGPNRKVTLNDRQNMPYTQATVLELLRYTSIVPLSVPHESLCITTLGGRTIPAGVQVVTNLYALHHDEEFWENPYEFHPERFLDAYGEIQSPLSDVRRHLMPFGAGPRVCVGEVLALGRLFLFIASTSQIFQGEAGPQKVSCDSREYVPGSLICQSDFELQMHCRNLKLFEMTDSST